MLIINLVQKEGICVSSQRNKSSISLLCFGFVGVILIAVGFYFLYWTKTPVYSVGLVREAVQNRNVALFERHVNLNSIYGKMIDDIGKVAVEKSGTVFELEPATIGVMNVFKPIVVESLRVATINSILEKQDNQVVPKEYDVIGELSGKIKESMYLENFAIQGMAEKMRGNDMAVVTLSLYNAKKDETVELDLSMRKLANGQWQIREISNFYDLLMKIEVPNNFIL